MHNIITIRTRKTDQYKKDTERKEKLEQESRENEKKFVQ